MAEVVEVVARLKEKQKFVKDTDEAADSVEDLGKAAEDAGKKAEVAGKKVTGGFAKGMEKAGKGLSKWVTLPAVGAGVAVLKMGGDFQSGMNRVRALTGATGGAFSKLEGQARDLGASTQFSASQAAGAMGDLAQAGFKPQQIFDAMPGVLALAAAGETDLSTAAQVASASLNQFGLGAKDTMRIVDALAVAAADTNTDVDTLGEALRYVGPVAKAAGVDFETTTAALGLLANAGLDASTGGTGLRGIFSRLMNTTPKAAKVLKRLGIDAKDSAGNLRPLDEIVQQFAKSGANASDIMAIFGDRAGPAMLNLIQAGAPALRKQTARNRESGEAAKQAAIRMEGFNGAMKQMQSAVEAAAIAFAQSGILGMFTGMIIRVTGWVSWLAKASPRTLKFIAVVVGLLAVLGPMLIITSKLVVAYQTLAKTKVVLAVASRVAAAAMWVFNASLWSNPIVLITVGIIALVAALVLAYHKVEWFRDACDAVFGWVRSNWPLLVGILFGPFGLAVSMIVRHWRPIIGFFRDLWSKVVAAFEAAWEKIEPIVDKIAAGIDKASGFLDKVGGGVSGAFRAIPGAGPALGAGVDLLDNVTGQATGGVTRRAGLSWVGERGPELLRLPVGARVDPLPPSSHALGGGETVVHTHVHLDGREIARSVNRHVAFAGARA